MAEDNRNALEASTARKADIRTRRHAKTSVMVALNCFIDGELLWQCAKMFVTMATEVGWDPSIFNDTIKLADR